MEGSFSQLLTFTEQVTVTFNPQSSDCRRRPAGHQGINQEFNLVSLRNLV